MLIFLEILWSTSIIVTCNLLFFLPGGIDNIEIDMEKQRVYVTSALSSDELLETIKKAGKTCSYVGTA